MADQHTRSATEMMDLILGTAREDDRIRAVVMNGSRVNPNVAPDAFQDFDIIYVVTDVESFLAEDGWIDRFGPLLILQTPDTMLDANKAPHPWTRFTYLAQFLDGNRIDLTLMQTERAETEVYDDSLRRLLLDKDGRFGSFFEPNDSVYHIRRPEEKAFQDCCNEFFWVSVYVAKGLWRGQPVYARNLLESAVRKQLMKMLDWHVGRQGDYAVTTGAYGKYLPDHLDDDMNALLQRTWKTQDSAHMWGALFAMIRLFRRAARPLAEAEGFTYPDAYDRQVPAFLRHIRNMPPDAAVIYP